MVFMYILFYYIGKCSYSSGMPIRIAKFYVILAMQCAGVTFFVKGGHKF